MTDELVSFGSAPEAGEPAVDTSTPEAAPSEQPQYLTVEAFRAELAKAQATIVEEARRAAQSQAGKQLSGMEKKLAGWQKRMEEQGIPVTQQMLEQGRARLAMAELERQQEDDSEAPHPAAPAAVPAVVEYVREQANAICDEFGVQITPADPEYRMLALTDPDPRVFLESVRAAANAKRTRAGANAKPQGARAPMAVTGQGQGGNLMDQYLRDITKVQPGSERALQIRRAYRQKGLNI